MVACRRHGEEMRRVVALAGVGVIPWIPASPPGPRVPPLAPPCRAAELKIHAADPAGLFFDNGATGWLTGALLFRNEGRPCSLVGQPRVRFVGGGAHEVGQSVARLSANHDPARPPDALPLPFSTRALPRGSAASVELWWNNWCAGTSPTSARRPDPPAAIEVSLPHGGGSARLRIGHAPSCVASAPSTIQVGVFQPWVPQPRPATQLPFRLRFDRL